MYFKFQINTRRSGVFQKLNLKTLDLEDLVINFALKQKFASLRNDQAADEHEI